MTEQEVKTEEVAKVNPLERTLELVVSYATAEELTALTRKRMLRDSLQTQFDVLCAKIKYIHKRQKQATEQ